MYCLIVVNLSKKKRERKKKKEEKREEIFTNCAKTTHLCDN